jgi:hypothetical protein
MILTADGIENRATRSAGEDGPVAAGEHTVETTWDGLHMVTARCSCGAWLARSCFWSDRPAREQTERTVLADLHDRRSEASRRRRPR